MLFPNQPAGVQRGHVMCVLLVMLQGGKAFVRSGKDKFQRFLASSRTACPQFWCSLNVLLCLADLQTLFCKSKVYFVLLGVV